MADVIITPASGLIDFQNASGISSATIQLDGNGNLALSAAGGDIQIGDTSADIFIGDGINNVDLIFEENGEIRGLTGKTITLGQSDSFISFAGDITGNVDFTGTLTAGQNGKIVFPDNTTVPDSPTNQQHDYITFGANGSISQVSGRGALLFTSSDDSMVIANGDVGRAFTNSNINVGDESIFLLSDNALYVKTDLQEGWGTENNLIFSNTGVLSVNGNTVWHAGNDGAGSGLDADLLDGISSASFLRSDAADTFTGVLTSNVASTGAIVLNKTVATNYAGISWQEVGDLRWLMYVSNNADGTFNLQARKNGTNVKQVFSVNQSTGIFDFSQSSATIASNTIWHAGNDGAGSGLDADTVDGIQGASFLRSDANDTLSAIITGHASNTEVLRIRSSSYSTKYIYYGGWSSANSNDISRIRSSGNLHIDSPANGHLYFNWYASNRTIYLGNTGQTVRAAGSNTVWHAGNDGSGSGLDADTLDGVNSGSFLRSDATDTYDNGQLNIRSNSANGHYWGAGLEYYGSAWRHTNDNSWGFAFRNSGGITDIYTSTAAGTAGATATYKAFRIGGSSSLLQYDGNNIWHAGNDGSGSGLDADTVDGFHSYQGSIRDARADGDVTPTNFTNRSFDFRFTDDIAGSTRTWDSVLTMKGWDGSTYRAWQLIGNSSTSGDTDTNLYFREGIGSSWGSLQKIWTSGNDGSGSGLDADLLDGLNLQAGAATANTVVGRNGSGDIHVRLTRSTYGNQSTISGAMAYRINNGTDNYVRFCSDTSAIRTFLGVTGTGSDGNYLKSNASDQYDGQTSGRVLRFRCVDGRNAGSSSGSLFPLEIYQNSNVSNSDAAMAFHIAGRYAAYFGLNRETNDLFFGGWSRGAAKYKIWHAANDGAGSGLDADTIDGTQLSNLMTLSGTQTITGDKDFDGTVTFDLLNGPNTDTRDKIRVWNASSYTIGMKNGFSYGGLGGSGTNYAMSFQMSNTDDRGFWWGDGAHTDAQGAMALTTQGRATIAHSLRIGYGESDSVVPGATHRLDVSGSILATSNITAYSDINLKKNIEVIPNALDKVSQIRGVTFDRIDLEDESRQSGVIAQEVEKVLPEVVRTSQDGTKTVAYGNMVGLLIEAIKEQQKQIDDLKAKLEEGN
mgnify:CR=1 FL=1